jgi:NAD(P)-dependent dehydrogenase (short-subunit alcohol dehydrogenase family)
MQQMSDSLSANSRAKIAILTGGSRGLGRNTALALARDGVDVILTYHSNRTEADSAVAEIEALGRRAKALQLDTGNVATFDGFTTEVKAVLAGWGASHFDYLINNAGHQTRGALGSIAQTDFDGLVNVHLKGVLFLTQALLPLMNDGGRIINISSGLARFTAPGSIVYGSLKAAVEQMTRYMAQELGPRGITVNVVAPGAIETDFGGGVLRNSPEAKKHVAGITALGRTGVADDIGPMIASLLSDANRWVTGQRIEASGGMHL